MYVCVRYFALELQKATQIFDQYIERCKYCLDVTI